MEEVFKVFSDELERLGPGSEESTLEAYSLLKNLYSGSIDLASKELSVLDVGAGTGAQTLTLANAISSKVIATDFHKPYVVKLNEKAQKLGLRIEARCEDMNELDSKHSNLDMIWSEGALYSIGIEKALKKCFSALKKDGILVFSHLCLIAKDISKEVSDYFAVNYPEIKNIEENRSFLNSIGFEVLSDFSLKPSDFIVNYYEPLERRMEDLLKNEPNNSKLEAFIEELQKEIDLYRSHKGEYSYQMFVCVKTR